MRDTPSSRSGFRLPQALLPIRPRTAAFAAVRRAAAGRSPVEFVALAAVAATPVVLFLDYRASTNFVAWRLMYIPIGEGGGRPAPYNQIWGLTQAMWLAAAVAVLFIGGWRTIVQNAQLVLLILALDVLLVASATNGGIDSTTVLNLGATLVPYVAMIAVVGHPLVTPRTARDLVTVACASGALVVVLTFAKKALAGALDQRLATFAFGPAPETGVVLAALLVLVPAMRVRRLLAIATAVGLAVGLVLTQTRGAFIAAIVGAVALIAMGQRRVRLLAFIALGTAAGLYVLFSRRSLAFTDQASAYRRQNLDHHWQLFLDRPVLGHGISWESISAVRAAHNTLLSVADAGGLILLFVWVVAWIVLPISTAFIRRKQVPVASVGMAATITVIVGWSTTGSDVFDYNPPTNLLPLMLGVALIGPPTYGRFFDRWSEQARGLLQPIAAVLACVGVVVAVILTSLAMTGVVHGRDTQAMAPTLRVRSVVAAQGKAFSSCGACRVVSMRRVARDIVEARLAGARNVPSNCLFVAPGEYRPRSHGVSFPGVAWGECTGTTGPVPQSVSTWLGSPASGSGVARVRARAAAEEWLAKRCASSCPITSLKALTPTIWKVRARPPSLPGSVKRRRRVIRPASCFYLFLDNVSPRGTNTRASQTVLVSCR